MTFCTECGKSYQDEANFCPYCGKANVLKDNRKQENNKANEFRNSIDDFIFVEGDTFKMGSEDGAENEKPVHLVSLSDFYIAKYPVTQSEWEEVMGKNPSHYKGNKKNPVESITWYEAIEYCNKKSINEGLKPAYSGSGESTKCTFRNNGYRLPTEAEWEYAAKGGKLSKGYIYSGSNNIKKVAEFEGNNHYCTKPVGGKKANELGLYDMTGNVLEWCWDWFGHYIYDLLIDPQGPTAGSNRVIRGGSFYNSAHSCRVVRRSYSFPANSINYIGFRLVRSSD